MSSQTIHILYDGECPLCKREVSWLRRRDTQNRLSFEDITSDNFRADKYGKTDAEVMARIHAVLPDGRLVEGLEVFRAAYNAIGLGWIFAPTGWRGLRSISNAAYALFAKYRPRLKGCTDSCALKT